MHIEKLVIKVVIVTSFLLLFGCVSTPYIPTRREKEKEKAHVIRVAVEKNVKSMELISENADLISNGNRYKLSSHTRMVMESGHVIVNGISYSIPVFIESPNTISINGKNYFGFIILRENLIINVLPVEEYLKGVLSSEVFDSWPIEALKAQAVVSRTYAYRRIITSKDKPYDLEGSEVHQMFEYNESNENINNAVLATRGIVILYKQEPIEAFFHSCSGGMTENCSDIFQKDLPYLRSVPDPYCRKNDHFLWTYEVSAREIKEALKDLIIEEYHSLPLEDVKIYKRTGSGRVKEFILNFERNKSQIIKGNTFRLALNPKALKSLLIQRIQKKRVEDGYVFIFSGKGYGHGVGLSQWGAKEMAEHGFTYRDIISYYYRGTKLGNSRSVHLEE